ncbi:hypothetical protein Sste5346_000136 [Sporothrix stenoceras]|uniref:SGNH hydrolase-type esterase domain-containing protein n=1 Tax=Sporothrix stenoceras TaxID=5173 RepID=A0ABR3ZTS3_9PEZI
MRAASFLAASSWLFAGGPGPAHAAVLPAAITDAWQTPQKLLSWLGDTKQKTLVDHNDKHDPERGDTGLRWTSKGFASLGDSYSAGIGTHLDGGKEESCRLGFGAYPALLHVDLGIDDVTSTNSKDKKGKKGKGDKGDEPNITAFQWLSCTGATTADVLGSPASSSDIGSSSSTGQINALLTDPTTAALDYITLSIGGNDLGFFDVINACVFRFYGYYSGTCEAALRASELLLAEDDVSTDPASFSARLTVILLQLLERVKWEKHPQFRIVVTGYARFFNAETDLCDSASMSVWWHYGNATGVPDNATDTTYLTKGLRRRMNGLVAGTNRKLKAIVDSVNARYGNAPHVLFVDYDDAFEGHRFCEPDVVEPDYTRDATWFFLVGGTDNDIEGLPGDDKPGKDKNKDKGDKGKKSVLVPTVDPNSYLVDPVRCREMADARGDWGERALCDMVQAQAANPGLLPAVGSLEADDDTTSVYGNGRLVSPENSMWYVPTYYGKIFHPRSNGHMAMRDAIYRTWEENGI